MNEWRVAVAVHKSVAQDGIGILVALSLSTPAAALIATPRINIAPRYNTANNVKMQFDMATRLKVAVALFGCSYADAALATQRRRSFRLAIRPLIRQLRLRLHAPPASARSNRATRRV